jgi:predicted aspartyl protease
MTVRPRRRLPSDLLWQIDLNITGTTAATADRLGRLAAHIKFLARIINRAMRQRPYVLDMGKRRGTFHLTIFVSGLLLTVLLAGCQMSAQRQQYQYGGSDTRSIAGLGYPGDSECAMWRATLEDRNGNPALLQSASEIVSRCNLPHGGSTRLTAAPSIQTELRPSARKREEIQIEKRGSSYYVPVRINDTITIPFHLDTGADDLAIPADVAMTLVRAGALTTGDFIGQNSYRMANGSKEVNDVVVLREVRVGDHVVRNVSASITSAQGDPLLGQSFLLKFGAMTIDYKRRVLVLSP